MDVAAARSDESRREAMQARGARIVILPDDATTEMIERCAALGFSHALLGAARGGAADDALLDRVTAAKARGLSPMLDLRPDRVPAGSPLAQRHPDLFERPAPERALDPRSYAPEGEMAAGRFDTAADALAALWADVLRPWQSAGVVGFRLLSLAAVPAPAVHALIAAVRAHGPATMLGWTHGMSPAAADALRGVGLDYVASSFPWWDFRADWFWSELDRLRAVAPVIMPVGGLTGLRDRARRRRALAAAVRLGDGWLMPVAFGDGLDADIAAANAMPPADGMPAPVSAPRGPVAAVLRRDRAKPASLTLINADMHAARRLDPAAFVVSAGLELPDPAPTTLAPGEVRTLTLTEPPPIRPARARIRESAGAAARAPRLGIENVSPSVEGGRFAAKRNVGDRVVVQADILCDGHDQLSAVVLWRAADETIWREARMRLLGNDRWQGEFPISRVGRYEFTIEAWHDGFASYHDELRKKVQAGVNVSLELIEGVTFIAATAARTKDAALAELLARLQGADVDERTALLLDDATAAMMARLDDRPFAARPAALFPIDADRVAARFASWYEIFPRSMSDDVGRHGTFLDVMRHLPRIRDMGFDVLYFPPIHPIGVTNRKGRNNTLTPAADDPGSPYAIGASDGGHEAIHAELGSLDDFLALRDEAAANGLELALDFAIQCSPDHPWLRGHPGWFAWRPDGSIKYAENPPKKYQDIVNVDFYAKEAVPELWLALAEVVRLWVDRGVRIFRVDNPHTKPFPFWEWLIEETRAHSPDVIFLAEAFTRPKIMARLGKIGFSQSYTYFTWRNTRRELEEYLTELNGPEWRDCYRPNFFVNTPDINPVFLQGSGRPGFLIRAALAATLAGSWGVYCGFELCEATPIPGREEYLDSEKYQLRAWDWDRPGNIVSEITELNHIRRRNPALHTHLGLTFLPTANEQMLVYEKATPNRDNVVLVAVSLDPVNPQTADVEWPLWKWGLPDQGSLEADDLLGGGPSIWHGKWRRITLSPRAPYAIWRARPAA